MQLVACNCVCLRAVYKALVAIHLTGCDTLLSRCRLSPQTAPRLHAYPRLSSADEVLRGECSMSEDAFAVLWTGHKSSGALSVRLLTRGKRDEPTGTCRPADACHATHTCHAAHTHTVEELQRSGSGVGALGGKKEQEQEQEEDTGGWRASSAAVQGNACSAQMQGALAQVLTLLALLVQKCKY
jgi:hypothetical protein